MSNEILDNLFAEIFRYIDENQVECAKFRYDDGMSVRLFTYPDSADACTQANAWDYLREMLDATMDNDGYIIASGNAFVYAYDKVAAQRIWACTPTFSMYIKVSNSSDSGREYEYGGDLC